MKLTTRVGDASKDHLRSTNIFFSQYLAIEKRYGRGIVLILVCLSRRDASINMKLDLLGSPRDLDLRLNFDPDLSRSSCIYFYAS